MIEQTKNEKEANNADHIPSPSPSPIPEQDTIDTTESYTMSEPQQPPINAQCGQDLTNKLLIELELLENVQNTAYKLEQFENIKTENNEKKIDLERQQNELMTVLNGIKTDIEYIQSKKTETEQLAERQIELIKNTGIEMSNLIKQNIRNIRNEQEPQHQVQHKQNLELIQISTNILANHQHQNDKEKEDLHQTLKIAMNLLDKYSKNLQKENKNDRDDK